MTNIMVDASAWIEYFNGSNAGNKISNVVEDPNNKIYTNSMTISEIANFYSKLNKDFTKHLTQFLTMTSIINLTPEMALNIGLLHTKLKKKRSKLGIVDSLVIQSAVVTDSKILTCDNDFRNLHDTIIIQKN